MANKDLVKDVAALHRTLVILTGVLSSEPEFISEHGYYEFLLDTYKYNVGKPFPVKDFPTYVTADMTYSLLIELLDNWEASLDWPAVMVAAPTTYAAMTMMADEIATAAEALMEYNNSVPTKPKATKKGRTTLIPNDKAEKLVSDFLNGDYISSLFITHPSSVKSQRGTQIIDTYGEYCLSRNKSTAFVDDEGKSTVFLDRAEALQIWFATQITHYASFLRGDTTGRSREDAEEAEFIGNLLAGVHTGKSGSTEKDWSIGASVNVTFTGVNLPGVALRVEPVQFTQMEIQGMAAQVKELNKIAKQAEGLGATPDSVAHSQGIIVKIPTHFNKFEKVVTFSTYNLSLVNIDRPAEDLVKQITTALGKPASERPPLISCLFHGVPGSGKSQFANYLGEQLGLRVLKKTYADIQSMYVGEGEKNLSQAFAEATQEGAILLIDELDSIAGNRQNADKNYQKTMVNQLLTELDSFKGIFIATSNFQESLDPAVLRRLFLKLEFKFMNETQVQDCFELYFPKLKKSKIGFIDYLTPGDFHAIREASMFDVKKPTVKRIRELLNAEVSLKKKTLGAVMKAERKTGYEL